jgi:hypothetical protein
MGWRIFTKEADGVIGKSSEIATEVAALGFAGDMIQDGIEVLRIEAPDGVVIDAEAIAARSSHRAAAERQSRA